MSYQWYRKTDMERWLLKRIVIAYQREAQRFNAVPPVLPLMFLTGEMPGNATLPNKVLNPLLSEQFLKTVYERVKPDFTKIVNTLASPAFMAARLKKYNELKTSGQFTGTLNEFINGGTRKRKLKAQSMAWAMYMKPLKDYYLSIKDSNNRPVYAPPYPKNCDGQNNLATNQSNLRSYARNVLIKAAGVQAGMDSKEIMKNFIPYKQCHNAQFNLKDFAVNPSLALNRYPKAVQAVAGITIGMIAAPFIAMGAGAVSAATVAKTTTAAGGLLSSFGLSDKDKPLVNTAITEGIKNLQADKAAKDQSALEKLQGLSDRVRAEKEKELEAQRQADINKALEEKAAIEAELMKGNPEGAASAAAGKANFKKLLPVGIAIAAAVAAS